MIAPKPRCYHKRLQLEPHMTIAVGFQCIDGLVLCTDSLETDTVTKRFVNKLWAYEVQGGWGLLIASAGESDLADSFNDGLNDILGNSDFNEARLFAKLKAAIKSVRVSYPDSQFAFLAGIYSISTLYARIFRVNDQSLHLGPVRRYQALGIGGSLASFLASQLYKPMMLVDEAVRLGVFVLSRVKEHVDGCDGPISVASYKSGERSFKEWTQTELCGIQNDLTAEGLKTAIAEFWKSNNPPSVETNFSNNEGGGVRWRAVAKLGTME